MSDLIRKEDVLMQARPEYLNPQQKRLASYNQGWNDALDEYVDRIKEIPSESILLTTGKWIPNENGTYSCSLCQSWIPAEQKEYARYCLYCGNRMNKELEE